MSYDADVGKWYYNVYLKCELVLLAAATTGGDTNWDKIIKLCDRIRESFGSAA